MKYAPEGNDTFLPDVQIVNLSHCPTPIAHRPWSICICMLLLTRPDETAAKQEYEIISNNAKYTPDRIRIWSPTILIVRSAV